MARALSAAGADVALGYRHNRTDAEALAARLGANGRRAVAVGGDMAVPDQVRGVVGATVAQLGPVDVLVANAGAGERAALADLDVEAWDRMMAVNLRAPFLLAQAVVPGMRSRRFGRIVFMSSVAAFTGGILGPHYTASKAGLIGLARSLAGSLAADGITVNAVAPALVDTDMIAGDPSTHERLAASIPVGRLGRPEEVAGLVVAVVANAYVTGQTFSVDGGLHPR